MLFTTVAAIFLIAWPTTFAWRLNRKGLDLSRGGRGQELSQENAQSYTLSTIAESSDGRASQMVSGHQDRGDGVQGGGAAAGGGGGGAVPTIEGLDVGAAGQDGSFGKPRGIAASGSLNVVADYKPEGEKGQGLNSPQKEIAVVVQMRRTTAKEIVTETAQEGKQTKRANERDEAEARRGGGANSEREGERTDDDNGNGEGGGEQNLSRMSVMGDMVRQYMYDEEGISKSAGEGEAGLGEYFQKRWRRRGKGGEGAVSAPKANAGTRSQDYGDDGGDRGRHRGGQNTQRAAIKGETNSSPEVRGVDWPSDFTSARRALQSPSPPPPPPAGTVTTLAGQDGTFGQTQLLPSNTTARCTLQAQQQKFGQVATSVKAGLTQPNGVTISPDGSLAVLKEHGGHVVRKIAVATKAISLLAGSSKVFKDATGSSARFHFPSGLAYSRDGAFVLIADQGIHCIRKIVIANQRVTTLAGSGEEGHKDATGTSAKLGYPVGLAISPDGSYALICEHCLKYRLNSDNTRCLRNSCKCENGTPKSGSDCTSNGASICKACNSGLRFSSDNTKCLRNSCRCDNGTPKSVSQCTRLRGWWPRENDSTTMSHRPYHLAPIVSTHVFHKLKTDDGASKHRKLQDSCKCNNGTPKSGSDCTRHGASMCKACNSGFRLKRTSIVDKSNRIVKGSFEGPVIRMWRLTSSKVSLPGWKTTKGNVEWGAMRHSCCCKANCAHHGRQLVDMCGNRAGRIEQVINTEEKCSFKLSFAINTNNDCNCGSSTKVMRVYAGGNLLATERLRRKCSWNNRYTVKTIIFTPTQPKTTIAFESVSNSCGCMLIDDVRVVPHQSIQSKCLQNSCKCANGTPKSGSQCTSHDASMCKSCNSGFRLNDDKTKCLQNSCKCANGTPKSGSQCTSHDASMCKSCN
eukprot:COSAG05_NODE_2626_length_2827_cov_6.326979_1_plen_911_part_10